jgi:two-component system nitrate/nitrite response regulator NarL
MRDFPAVENATVFECSGFRNAEEPSPTEGRRMSQSTAGTRLDRLGGKLPNIRTVVVDSDVWFRAGIVRVLAKTRFPVEAEYPSLDDIRPETFGNDLCLLLIGFNADDGVSESSLRLSNLRRSQQLLRAIVFYECFNFDSIFSELDADGYLLKNMIDPDLVLKTIEVVLLGVTVLPDRAALNNAAKQAGKPSEPMEANGFTRPFSIAPIDNGTANDRLSLREQKILRALMRGQSNKHIALDLSITVSTVKAHVKNLLLKIGMRNRTQAAMWGAKHLDSEDC